MVNFIWLVFAHYIGDIALQSQWQADNKGKHWYFMLCHCMVWTAVICVALQYLGLFELWKVLFLVLGHAAMDEWKSHQPKTPENFWKIYPDQGWHLVQILIVYLVR